MVYSYNQGVILSGLRGLWTATGQDSYLDDGHALIRNVMAATGWVLPRSRRSAPSPISAAANSSSSGHPSNSTRWAGLGRRGILEESCDFAGNCAQDPQTFKAIFWHHLRVFCRAIAPEEEAEAVTAAGGSRRADGLSGDLPGTTTTSSIHRARCATYKAWVRWNAQAALRSRDADGHFGMWWRADDVPRRHDRYFGYSPADAPRLPAGAEDRFAPEATVLAQHRPLGRAEHSIPSRGGEASALQLQAGLARREEEQGREGVRERNESRPIRDPNSRGRGRTVETQSGGVAVLAAWWEFENL